LLSPSNVHLVRLASWPDGETNRATPETVNDTRNPTIMIETNDRR
jgi:hypothetical protein